MKDIDQLANSLLRLQKQKQFDININIPVNGKAYLDCLRLNQIVCQTNNSPIAFSNNGLIFPHVTLKMGTVNCGCFDSIIAKLGDFAKRCTVMSLTPSPVILKTPANKYYFSEIADERLLAITSELDQLLSDEMQVSRFPLSKDNLHHVTLGYKYPEDTTVASVIGQCVAPFVADRMHVSVMGGFGVCIGVLKTFYFNDYKE